MPYTLDGCGVLAQTNSAGKAGSAGSVDPGSDHKGTGWTALIEKSTCYPGRLLETGRLLDTWR